MFGATSCLTALLLVVAAAAAGDAQTISEDHKDQAEDQRQAKGVQMFGVFDKILTISFKIAFRARLLLPS